MEKRALKAEKQRDDALDKVKELQEILGSDTLKDK